jgi:hypothetical protein
MDHWEEDAQINKDRELRALERFTKAGRIDKAMLPVLPLFNRIPGVVTSESCEGHKDTPYLHMARVHLRLSREKWSVMIKGDHTWDFIFRCGLTSVKFYIRRFEYFADEPFWYFVELATREIGDEAGPLFKVAADRLLELHRGLQPVPIEKDRFLVGENNV